MIQICFIGNLEINNIAQGTAMQAEIELQCRIRQELRHAYQNINITIVNAYWLIGKRIVGEGQLGAAEHLQLVISVCKQIGCYCNL